MNWQTFYENNKHLGEDEARAKYRRIENDRFEEERMMYEAAKASKAAKELGGIYGGGRLAVPVLSQGVDATAGHALLNWTAVSGANNYKLEQATSADFATANVQDYSGPLLTFNKAGLTSAVTYYFRVKAEDTNTTPVKPSLWSNTITVVAP